MTQPLISIRELSVAYRAGNMPVRAVDAVSLTVNRGEILGIVGESGSGKTTLANAVARLLKPPAVVTGGSVTYHRDGYEHDLLHLPPNELRRFRWKDMSVVFQSAMNSLNPVATIGAQIDDVLHTHAPEMTAAARRERAAALLRRVGISAERVRAYPHELSGGMRQRAAIAIALALDPEIVIMDEPTTALDVVMQRDILREIKALRSEYGFAVMFITHDLSLLLAMADRIAVMYAGRLVEIAAARELHDAPAHPYTLGLLRSFPRLRGPRVDLAGIPGSPPDLRDPPSGCPFHPRCRFAHTACERQTPQLIPVADGHLAACLAHEASVYGESVPPELVRSSSGAAA